MWHAMHLWWSRVLCRYGRSRPALCQGGTRKRRDAGRDSGHFWVLSYFRFFSLLHVQHILILEVVHMVFFLVSENSQWDDVQHSWNCDICATALNTSNRPASTDSGAERIWKWIFQNDCRDDSTFSYTVLRLLFHYVRALPMRVCIHASTCRRMMSMCDCVLA